MIRNVRIYAETKKAWHFSFVYDKKLRWVPKSVVGLMTEKDRPDERMPSGIWSVEIADWWLEKAKKEDKEKDAYKQKDIQRRRSNLTKKAKEQEKDQGIYERHITNTRMTFIGKLKRRK